MARAKYTDESHAFPARYKSGFDERIVEEYVLSFLNNYKDESGRQLPEDKIWMSVAEYLCIDGTTKWRFVNGVDRTGKRPLSPFDGRAERYRPGPEEILRFIAAQDLMIGSIAFPRGRIIVNRALARALTGLRRVATDEDLTIDGAEVGRLRFLENWNRSHLVTSGFSAETVRDMCSQNRDNLMGEIDISEQFILSLNRLYTDWSVHYTRLLHIISYDWLR